MNLQKKVINFLLESINPHNKDYNEWQGKIDDIYFAYTNSKKYLDICKQNLSQKEMILQESIYLKNKKKIELDYTITKLFIISNNKDYFVTDEMAIDINEVNKDNIIKTYYHLILKPISSVLSLNNFERKLIEISVSGKKPRVLLHSCCGPCSSYVLEYLSKYFEIDILYYNPNIDNKEEFQTRLAEQQRIVAILKEQHIVDNIQIIVPEYNHEEYSSYIKGYENYKEGEIRCYKCYKQRLEVLASLCAKSKDRYDFFTTTLSVSPYKNSTWLNQIGEELSKQYNCNYLYANFKLHDGYKRSVELSKKYNLYRQSYCGCEYSYKEL